MNTQAETGQALCVIHGQPITEADILRLCRKLQNAQIALMNEVFAHNRTRQLVTRLEVELFDCGELPTYSLTPKGIDYLDEMDRGA
jgi:hypothetical protein